MGFLVYTKIGFWVVIFDFCFDNLLDNGHGLRRITQITADFVRGDSKLNLPKNLRNLVS